VGLEELAAEKNWEEALPLLERFLKRVDHGFQTADPYLVAAAIWRGLDNGEAERGALESAVSVDGNQLDAYERLIELELARENWQAVVQWSRLAVGMNPFLTSAYRTLARAAEQLDRPEEALAAIETMLKLEPLNPAELHYQAARLRKDATPERARLHLLLALEEAPRFRDAHRLLLELDRARVPNPAPQASPEPTPPPGDPLKTE